MARALTTKVVEAAKPDPNKRREISDPALSGLYLVVQQRGGKSWALRYRHRGKPRKLTLGRWPVMGVTAARVAATDALEAVDHGGDPAGEKQAVKRGRETGRDTVRAQFDLYAVRHLAKLKSGATTRRELERHAVEIYADRDVGEIMRRDVRDLLDGIVESGRATTSNRVRAYLGKFLGWLVEREVIKASSMTGMKAPANERSRDRVLNDDEIRWIWAASERVGQPWGPLAQFLLLTGQRLGEAAAMTDSELRGDIWHPSADRTKNGRAHDVPISSQAQGVLNGITRIGPGSFIFTSNGDVPVVGFDKARRRLADAIVEIAREEAGQPVEIPHWTFHDLRRTAATGMARLGIPVRVTEALLNHAGGTDGGIVAVYQWHDYADEKRQALGEWGNQVATLTAYQSVQPRQ